MHDDGKIMNYIIHAGAREVEALLTQRFIIEDQNQWPLYGNFPL